MVKKKSQKIEETLQKLAADMSKENSQSSSNIDSVLKNRSNQLPGDPNCPKCAGIGFLRQDLPLGHPDFGKVSVCSCRQAQVSQQIRQQLFELSQLEELSHLTFENFKPRGHFDLFPKQADSLELAYNQAVQFSQTLNGWLLLQGGYGCGKTHLAAAIANFAVSIGVPALFITVPDMLDMLRFAYSDPESTFEERFDKIRQSPLLVLDDFGTQNATSWAQEKLFQIMNYRYINHLPLVITSNLADIDFEDRIQSRLQDPEMVTKVRILAPDYRNPIGDFGDHKLSSLGLHHNQTFASFDLREGEALKPEDLSSLKKAFTAAHKFAERPRGWIVLMGHYSCGKTHLAASIALYRRELGDDLIFKIVPDVLEDLKATFGLSSNISFSKQFEEFKSTNLLVLDDLGTQAPTPWVNEKLFQLFDHRYNAQLPTVITTSLALEELDPRLRSRMLDRRLCSIYGITVPPYTGSMKPVVETTTKRSRSKQR